MGHATSLDGIHWDKLREILAPRSRGNLDDWGIMAPTVTFREGKAVLFYTAFQEAAEGVRFGYPRENGTMVLASLGRAEAETLGEL